MWIGMMRIGHGAVLGCTLLISTILLVSAAHGQLEDGQSHGGLSSARTATPDVAVELSRGIYQFRLGLTDPTSLESAIQSFGVVLEKDSENATAYLLRALSHGRIGLYLAVEQRLGAEGLRDQAQKLLDIRESPELYDELVLRREVLTAGLEKAREESAVETLILEEGLRRLNRDIEFIDAHAEDGIETLRERVEAFAVQAAEATELVRSRYESMASDTKRAIQLLDDPPAVLHLLDVISQSKIARLNEEEAVGIQMGEVALADQSASVESLRQQSVDILEDVARTLKMLGTSELVGEDAVRTRFFLGVIRFRQAVPKRADDEELAIDEERLDQAEEIMRSFEEDPDATENWKSYGALYLGLILPVKASRESIPVKRQLLLDEAENQLRIAAAHDYDISDDDQPSRSNRAIPDIVFRQRKFITEKLRTAEVGASAQINDLKLTLEFGARYDTNVVLLGERTDLPRGVTDESDFGFTLNAFVDYTLNLGAIDPELSKWTLGFRARISQLWNDSIGEFDEQTYGGSMAVQYEVAPYTVETGPVYFQLQYDFALTLLGRERFLESASLTPRVRFYFDDRRKDVDFYVRYDIRSYYEKLFDKRFNRDGVYVAVGLSHSHRWKDMTPVYEDLGIPAWGHSMDDALAQDDFDYPSRYLTPFIGVEYSWDATDGEEFDLKSMALTFGANVPLPYGIALNSQFNYTWDDYSHGGSLVDFNRRRRRDFTQRYILALSRTFVLKEGAPVNRSTLDFDHTLMTLRAHASWTLDNSNVVDRFGQAIFEYDRAMYGISVAFSFN